jgi:hypothetical protein
VIDPTRLAQLQTNPNALSNAFPAEYVTTGAVGQSFSGVSAPMPTDPLVRKWTGPTGQTDWTRVVLEGGTAPQGIPIDYTFLQQQGWDPDALSVVRLYLQSLGLDDPTMQQWAMSKLVTGASSEQIALELREQPAYRKRFAAIFDRESAGLSPISAADVLAYESQARQLMREAGLPEGFYDAPDDFRKWIGGDVSLRELSTRLNDAFLAVQQGPADQLAELTRLYGVTQGGLAAWALDEDRAVPTLLRQVQAAQIGAAGRPAGYTLSAGDLESLAAYGITRQAAQQGFQSLYGMRELFGALPGEGVSDITQGQQLGATFTGDVAAQEAIQRRGESRAAVFGEAGGAIFDQRGSGTFR